MIGDLAYDDMFIKEKPIKYPIQVNALFVVFVTTIGGLIFNLVMKDPTDQLSDIKVSALISTRLRFINLNESNVFNLENNLFKKSYALWVKWFMKFLKFELHVYLLFNFTVLDPLWVQIDKFAASVGVCADAIKSWHQFLRGPNHDFRDLSAMDTSPALSATRK